MDAGLLRPVAGLQPGRRIFENRNAVLLGISVDNIPTLFAWTGQMGDLWFPVLSDFWPHGAVAERYGVLRSNGVAERAIVVIDRNGIIRYMTSTTSTKAPLESIVKALDGLR
jgi:peroxiredoxin (alkyl hydroperoxide reductase subunit C)